MTRMFVTREVSKVSGWLNADADCRAERTAYNAIRGAGRQTGGREATAAQAARRGGLDCILEGRAREGAHVSKPSGWLNAFAPCRESSGGHTIAGRGLGRAQGMGGAHVEHIAHACDAGCVKSQRLVE
eukprot:scaffold42367_cov61-Phaeocystis_antarctica.AAC.7